MQELPRRRALRSLPAYLAVAALAFLATARTASAQNDHLLCYKVKDPLALKGVVDFDSPAYGTVTGCRIGKPKVFCV